MPLEVPSPFAWDASFDVKVGTLNNQHKKLFELINALDAKRTDGAVLKELLDYVVMHFKTEEDLFHQFHWAEEADHKKVHDKFVQDALGLKSVGDGEMQFIKNWLVHHIKESDMHYAEFLVKNGAN